jgi:hypothetical protein
MHLGNPGHAPGWASSPEPTQLFKPNPNPGEGLQWPWAWHQISETQTWGSSLGFNISQARVQILDQKCYFEYISALSDSNESNRVFHT